MNNQRPQIAPFCWGQAVCFRATSKACAKCVYCTGCAQKVMSNLVIISEDINVSDLIVATRSFLDKRGVSVTDDVSSDGTKMRIAMTSKIKFDTDHVEDAISSISIRAQSIARAITKAGIDMRADANRSANSFKAINFKPDYMADIQDLCNQQAIFTRDMVKEAIRKNRDLKYSALNNSVSFAVSAMKALGFIKDIGDGKYALN